MVNGISNRNKVALMIIVIVTFMTITLDHFKAFERLEWISYDQRMKLFRSDHPLHPDIAVVLIDEASLQAMNPLVGRWPWPRELYAELLGFFALGGAHSVGFDILFTENERSSNGGAQLSHGDQQFIDAAANSGIAIQAFQVLREQSDGDEKIVTRNLPDDFVQQHSIKNAHGFQDVGNNSFLHPIPDLYRASKGVGIVEIEPDVCLSHDNTAAIAKKFAQIGVDHVKDPDKFVIVLDHTVPASEEKYAQNHNEIREFVQI